MRWTAPNLITGMQSLFGKSTPSLRGKPLESALGEIRSAMLQNLCESGVQEHAAIQRKIAYAHGFQDLWYLRGDVMAAIAAANGEAAARQKILCISNMFKGYLPRGLVSRPSPLND